jgi:tetratricopeptide (TPR) repeat protein
MSVQPLGDGQIRFPAIDRPPVFRKNARPASSSGSGAPCRPWKNGKTAVVLDPMTFSANYLTNLGETYMLLRRYAEAAPCFEKAANAALQESTCG